MAKKKSSSDKDYKDLYLRVVADFQNYKRRVEEERASWMREAQADVLTPLLSVIDNLERAVESCTDKTTSSVKAVRKGLELITKDVNKIFSDLGVEEIDCSGGFDPEKHEAVMQVDHKTRPLAKDKKPGDIVDVLSRGYTYKSSKKGEIFVLRHAKVSVAK